MQLIKGGKYDIFFNLCDGAWNDDTAGIYNIYGSMEYNFYRISDNWKHCHPILKIVTIISHYESPLNNYPFFPGVEVVKTLERFNVAFTGADSIFYEPSKVN